MRISDWSSDVCSSDLAFVVGQFHTERLPLRHVAAGDFESAFGQAQPAHAVRQAGRAQADLGQLQAVADFHQAIFIGNAQAVETQLAMPAMFFRTHDGDAAYDFPTRIVLVEHECRRSEENTYELQ